MFSLFQFQVGQQIGVDPLWIVALQAVGGAAGNTICVHNVVAACARCNLSKGSQLLKHSGLTLRKPPRCPGAEELTNTGRRFPPNHLHETWLDFLYWDAELEA